MNKPKFKVGDRVRAVESCDDNERIIGKTGTVKIITSDFRIGVAFDNPINGWKICNGVKEGCGWYCYNETLEPVNDNKIVITTDGKTTTAKLYDNKKLVKSAKAVCSPDDEFNFNIGAAIALERLTGQLESNLEVEEHFYNGKVVCVKNKDLESYFTVGKIYNVVNGELHSDDVMYYKRIESIEELNARFSPNMARFIEIIE